MGWLNGLQLGVIGEHPGDLAAERLVHAVVVVGVQEAPCSSSGAAASPLRPRSARSRARHEEVRNVPQLGASERHDALPLGDGERGALAQRREEVRQRGGAGVPVAAAVVMQAAIVSEAADGRLDEAAVRNITRRPPDRPSADRRRRLHSSFTNRYAVFLVMPVSAATCSATCGASSPAPAARARALGVGGGSALLPGRLARTRHHHRHFAAAGASA